MKETKMISLFKNMITNEMDYLTNELSKREVKEEIETKLYDEFTKWKKSYHEYSLYDALTSILPEKFKEDFPLLVFSEMKERIERVEIYTEFINDLEYLYIRDETLQHLEKSIKFIKRNFR